MRPVTAANQSSGVEYCTVGDDRFLRLWDLHSHSQKLCLDLNGMARACAYSPDGYYLAVGFGGTVGRGGKNKEDGIVRIFRFDTTSKGTSIMLVKEIKEAKAWISVVKYSPDGNYLAVGARDNNIYVYSVTQQYKRKAKFSKHNAGINQLDFSADGKYIQSCCWYAFNDRIQMFLTFLLS